MKRTMLALLMVLGAHGLLAPGAEPPPAAPPPATPPPAAPAAAASGNAASPAAADVDRAVAEFARPVEAAAGDSPLVQKLKEHHNTAVRLLTLRMEAYHKGTTDASTVFDAARLVTEAKMDLAQNDQERTAAAKQVLEVSKVVEARLEQQWKSGVITEASFLRARMARETAEIRLLQLQAGGASTQPK